MKSKVITIAYSEDPDDSFHYRVEEWKGNKVLLGCLLFLKKIF